MPIAVVGAGIAGLAAARALTRAGRSVVVFDKGRSVGGRMSSRHSVSNHWVFDHGAQYFTVRDEAFAEVVRTWEEAGRVERWPQFDDGTVRYRGSPNMLSLCLSMADGLAIRSRMKITRMACGADGWELRDRNDDWYGPYESVLLAIPAPQAAPLLEPVPDLAARVASVEMESCWAGLFYFDEPLGPTFDAEFVDRCGMAWMARRAVGEVTVADGGDGEAWVLHAAPDWNGAIDRDEALSGLRAALAALLDRSIPAARYERAHFWRYARTTEPLGEPFLWDSMRRVGACGDWCLGGRVEAAWLSGRALARATLR